METIYQRCNQEIENEVLFNEIREKVKNDGGVMVSWDCEGRTRHMMNAERLESYLENEFDFEIKYNYGCLITPIEEKIIIDMQKNESEIWIGYELLNNTQLLETIKTTIENKGNSKVILRFVQISPYHQNLIYLDEDVSNTLYKIDWLSGRTKSTQIDDKVYIDFIVGG